MSRVKIRVRIRARIEVRVRVRVSVSHIMTIWRWEEFSRCDKVSTTPTCLDGAEAGRIHLCRLACNTV